MDDLVLEPWPEGHKRCARCGTPKPLTEFAWTNKARGQRQPYCRPCALARGRDQKAKRRANGKARTERVRYAETQFDKILKRNYGISAANYEARFQQQGGVCAICSQPESAVHRKYGTLRRLAIDHDHETGEVRALLCHACNQGLGAFRDSPALLRTAIAYLERHRDTEIA